MCIKTNYNSILESSNKDVICSFMDNCENNCHKYGSCDYLGYLDDRLKELDGELEYCEVCGDIIRLYEEDKIFYSKYNSPYCVSCREYVENLGAGTSIKDGKIYIEKGDLWAYLDIELDKQDGGELRRKIQKEMGLL